MVAGNTCVADPVDTVHHKMNSKVRSNHVYKSVWSPVIGEQLILEKKPAGQSTQWICSGSDNGFSDSWPHSVGNLFTDHMVLYYTKGCRLLSAICHITGRRRKGKDLKVSCKYDYYCGPTKDSELIWDPVFIFVIMLFPRSLNETRHLYETGSHSRQCSSYIQ